MRQEACNEGIALFQLQASSIYLLVIVGASIYLLKHIYLIGADRKVDSVLSLKSANQQAINISSIQTHQEAHSLKKSIDIVNLFKKGLEMGLDLFKSTILMHIGFLEIY